jgi:hypothetical protein
VPNSSAERRTEKNVSTRVGSDSALLSFCSAIRGGDVSPRVRAIMTAAVLAFALAACGGGENGGVPNPTLSVPGRPADRVTDVAARALTEEQMDEILKKCGEVAGVPGTNDDCKDFMRSIRRPCTPRSQYCFYGGRVIGSDVGVIQVRDEQTGSPVCGGGKIALCEGIIVPADVVAALLETSTVPPSTSGHTPSPTISTPAATPPTSTPAATP